MKMKCMLLIFIFPFSVLLAENCTINSIQYIFDGKKIMKQESICFVKGVDDMIYITSNSCKQNFCKDYFGAPHSLKVSNLRSPVGSRGFKLCSVLGGTPQIFEYKFGKDSKWASTERCLINEKDFVEISYLTQTWKSFIQ